MFERSIDSKCHFWFETSHPAKGAGASAARIARMGIRWLTNPAN
jgi:hypothetical protein